MTNNSDSSAPNVPELTRLSGEQAEERAAREGRAAIKQDLQRAALELGCDEFHRRWQDAESECSRLASRVEELEEALANLVDAVKGENFNYHRHIHEGKPAPDCYLCVVLNEADELLAGAHAEERE